MIRRRLLCGALAAAMAGAGKARGQTSGGEYLIRGAYLLTMDPALGDIPVGDVHVRDGRLIAVGRSLPTPPGAEFIDGAGRVAMPGIVDTHWHTWNSLLRGLVGGTPQSGYFPTIQKYGPHYTPQDTYVGTRLALAEAANAGVTTVHNWAHNVRAPEHADASIRAIADSKLRARFGYGSAQGTPPDRLQDIGDLGRLKSELAGDGRPRLLTLGAALRGPQMSALATSRREFEAVRSLGLPISVHMTGNAEVSAKFKVIQTLAQDGFLGPDIQIIHAVHATPSDIETLAASQTHVSVSPYAESASMGVAPVNAMRKAGILVSLSIDNTALPASVDPFGLMRGLVTLLQARDGLGSPLGARQALQMATIDGARDLGLGEVTGSLTTGKRADLILVRIGDLNLTAAADGQIDRLLMAAQPVNVETVMVDGRLVKQGGVLVGANVGEIMARAREAAAELLKRAG
jgi:cytosine/adenosine deaminase-related metal-dependent hydrolase